MNNPQGRKGEMLIEENVLNPSSVPLGACRGKAESTVKNTIGQISRLNSLNMLNTRLI